MLGRAPCPLPGWRRNRSLLLSYYPPSVRKSQNPIPKSQATLKSQGVKSCDHNPLLFEMIAEKINVSSYASQASSSRRLLFAVPTSINRRKRRLSLASLRQIFARTRKICRKEAK